LQSRPGLYVRGAPASGPFIPAETLPVRAGPGWIKALLAQGLPICGSDAEFLKAFLHQKRESSSMERVELVLTEDGRNTSTCKSHTGAKSRGTACEWKRICL